MPNMVLVSVFDHAVLEFAPCMCVNSEAAAIRIFTNEVNRYDPNNLLSTNKSDFSLYVVGEFDLATGCVVNRDPRDQTVTRGQAPLPPGYPAVVPP